MSLTWTLDFRVNDNPLRATSRELVQFQERLGRTKDLLASVETATGKATLNLTRLSDAAGTAALTGATVALGALTVALGAAGAALWKFGDTANQAFSERTSTLRAYTTLLGSTIAAEKEFARAQALSQQTDFTSSQVEGLTKQLLVAGFRDQQLQQARAAALDVGAMASPKERQLTIDRVGRAFGQINAKGKLQGEELMQLSEAGLSRKLLVEQLKASGIADPEKAISKGQVSADLGIAAIERAILKQFGTSKLGEYATGASGSVSGLESNRDEGFQNLLKSFDSEQLPAVKAYKEALTEATAATSLQNESGQDLKIVLEDLANVGIGLRAAWTDFTTGVLEAGAASWVAALKEMGYTIEGSEKDLGNLRDMARSAGETLGELAGPIRRLADAIGETLTKLGRGWQDAKWTVTHPFSWLMGGDRGTIWDSARGQHVAVDEDATFYNGQLVEKAARKSGGDSYTEVDGKLVRSNNPFAGVKGEASARTKAALQRAGASGAAGGGGGGGAGGSGGGDSYTKIGAVVNLGGVTIEVAGGKHSPGEIADEVEQRLVRMVGRYARNPSKEIV